MTLYQELKVHEIILYVIITRIVINRSQIYHRWHIGAFLIAYENGISQKRKVGIAYVEYSSYDMKNYRDDLLDCEMFSMWIFGDCYESKRNYDDSI